MKSAFVLDASAAIAWASPDEYPPDSLSESIGRGDIVAPALWLYEVHHVLHMLRRRGRLSEGDYSASWRAVAALRVEVEPAAREVIETDISELAQEHGLTVYDAAYLELAKRRRLPLATLDDALRKVARKLKVRLV